MSDGIIKAKADNGFSGELKVGEYMVIYKNGREVLSTSKPAPKTKVDLEKVLEGMADFRDEYAGLMAQIKKALMEEGISGIKFMVEGDIIKVKWRHGDINYVVPFDWLLELWEKYKEQENE